ncbi:MAG: indolepyruvate oxidoreductase subunit beta [Acidobacteriota bacterium]|jgi:indolepyruvate ferredoxin oxidoreductase beta subunit|nr:indolepyruvate oxidoreductase subunit beta [Acidobacteriota bacterium]
MKCDIILAGVGGQGILSIATVLGYAAIESGLTMKQAEVHGMSQRGGAVQSHLRISDGVIHSDLVALGGADLVISVEPMEALRYLPWLGPEGWVITNSTPYRNIPDYPSEADLSVSLAELERKVIIDADGIAREAGNPRGMNMAVTGAASLFIDIPFEKMEEGVRVIFGRKGEDVVNQNLFVLREGRKFAAAARG